jgi:hypothetical protein
LCYNKEKGKRRRREMFVVTEEFEEFIDSMREMGRMLNSPRAILEMLAIGACFFIIYFGCIILADIMQIQ